MSDAPLLDTHAWVWWVHGDARLGRHVIRRLDELPPDDRPTISDISLWEVATLVSLGRLDFPNTLEAWLAIAASPKTVRVLPVTSRIAAEVARLPDSFHRDPADRIIVATSRVQGLPVLTKDTAIAKSGLVRLWSPGSAKAPPHRELLPRTFELKDETPTLCGYFQRLEPVLSKAEPFAFWSKREKEFAALESVAWEAFKIKVRRLPPSEDVDGRGWREFFDLLSEAAAFAYLIKMHCTGVKFIPETSHPTPDLDAFRDGRGVLCEVKTLNPSEGKAAQNRLTVSGESQVDDPLVLADGFFRKLNSHIASALAQMLRHDPRRQSDWVVFICLNTDDRLGDCRPEHLRLIDEHLRKNPVSEAKLVFYFLTNNFEQNLTMRSAEVYLG